ncbi:radical SAM protein [Xanthobacteraceae bacterium Astr-EGSB]|uniref:radical SAM protein n=1 Tax=Astrobacterium formosum TaxID=3069710 RepID=UPI0027B3ABA1|nr:radical SAM protein [Xanthobacteraceae bacterium Astr-EGSB]
MGFIEAGGISAQLAPPKIISMTMTSRCNLRCVMCDHGIRNVKKEDFKADLVDMAGDFIASASLVDLTGLGEPMLSDLFWNVLQKFPVPADPVDSQFFLTFNSNGTLLNERNIERVLQSRVRKIRISIDSADPDLFRLIRGTELKPIVDGLRMLIRRRNELGRAYPEISVEMTLMRANLHGVCDMIDMCADAGVNFLEVWSLNHVAEDSRAVWKVRRGDWTFDYAEQMVDGLPKAELDAAVDQFYQHSRQRGLPVFSRILGENRTSNDALFESFLQLFGDMPVPWQKDSIPCSLPWKELRIHYDGDVFACCWGPKPIGNLRTQTLESIWSGLAMDEMRSDLMAGVIPELCSGAACDHVGGRSTTPAGWRADPKLGAVLELSAVPMSYALGAGLHELESYEGRNLRWTNGSAEFQVAPLSVPGLISLRVKLWNVKRGPVAVSVNDDLVLCRDLPPDGLEADIDLGIRGAGASFVIRIDSALGNARWSQAAFRLAQRFQPDAALVAIRFARTVNVVCRHLRTALRRSLGKVPDAETRRLGVAIENLSLVCRKTKIPCPSSQPAVGVAL